jgi:hypothetical protein
MDIKIHNDYTAKMQIVLPLSLLKETIKGVHRSNTLPQQFLLPTTTVEPFASLLLCLLMLFLA